MSCAVFGCKRNNKCVDHNFHGFSFPKEKNLLKIWVNFCKRADTINIKSDVICDAHFKKDDFDNNLKFEMGFCKKRILKVGSFPTVDTNVIASTSTIRREKRMEIRARKELVSSILHKQEQEEKENVAEHKFMDTSVEMNSELTFQEENKRLQIENERLQEENRHLQSKCQRLQDENDNYKQRNFIYAETIQKKYLPEIRKLNAQLKQRELENKNIEEKLLVIFTEGQIKKIKNNNKRGQKRI